MRPKYVMAAPIPPGTQSIAIDRAVVGGVFVDTPVNSTSLTAADTAPAGMSPEQAVNGGSSGVGGAGGSAVNAGSGVALSPRFPLDTPQYYISLGIQKYSRTSWATVGQLAAESTIILPLPEQLIDQQAVAYDEVPVGVLGGAIMKMLGGGMSLNSVTDVGNVRNALGELGSGATNIFVGAGQRVAQAVGGLAIGDPASAIMASQGLAVNDFLTVLLKGPKYKRFQLSWRLSPKNSQESRAIKAIEILLKNAQAPGWAGGTAAFFAWPRVFNIKFKHAGGTDMGDRLFRFKPMVLTDSAFNYAPGGVPSFYGQTQYPEGVMIMLNFLELELWVNSNGDAQDAYGTPAGVTGITSSNQNDLAALLDQERQINANQNQNTNSPGGGGLIGGGASGTAAPGGAPF